MPASLCDWLPARDRRFIESNGLDVECVEHANQKAVIIRNFEMPEGKFKIDRSDILILLPPAYPDVPPDMFYAEPWLHLKNSERYPNQADHFHSFADRSWQRWSRHSTEWRPGTDGLRSHVRRIRTALETAK